MVRAGTLRNFIEHQTKTRTQNSKSGAESVGTWAKVSSIYASIIPLSGRELMEGRQFNEQISHKIIVRFNLNIKSDDRLKLGTRTFQIASIFNVNERNREMQLLCVERPNDPEE